MNLYINDKFIKILKSIDHMPVGQLDREVDNIQSVSPSELAGTVLLKNVKPEDISTIISWIETKKLQNLNNLYCLGESYQEIKDYIKGQFRIVRAAGGLVKKRDKFLMIYRLGKWDLPKGKLEKNEKTKEAAEREVKEECGVEAEVINKLCTTWHTYIQEGKRILKKSTWYNMNCVDDTNMEPQYIENIEDIRWMNWNECQKALKNSYRSIHGVFEAWAASQEKKEDQAKELQG
jgi:8-oxo-dGTP pyrophosphatase MutT (NUDIX family)